MTPDEYQAAALTTANYESKITYPALGLIGEAGEVAEKVKKLHRDGNWNFLDPIPEDFIKAISLELGDVMWYASVLAHDLGYKLSEITDFHLPEHNKLDLVKNVAKLHYACSYTSSSILCQYHQGSSPKGMILEVVNNVGFCARIIGYSIEDICEINIRKLADRKARNVIHGNGDYR